MVTADAAEPAKASSILLQPEWVQLAECALVHADDHVFFVDERTQQVADTLQESLVSRLSQHLLTRLRGQTSKQNHPVWVDFVRPNLGALSALLVLLRHMKDIFVLQCTTTNRTCILDAPVRGT